MAGLVVSLYLLSCLLLGHVLAGSDKTIIVGASSCGGTIDMEDIDDLHLKYLGGSLSGDCKFTIKFDSSICVYPKKFELHCSTKLYFDKGLVGFSHDETYSCSQRLYSEYCTLLSPLTVTFKKDYSYTGRSSTSDNLDLKIYEKSTIHDNITDVVKTSLKVIIGIIVTVVVGVVVLIVVIICCCCKKRRSSGGGTVYRSPQQAQPMTAVTYPAPAGVPPPQQPAYPAYGQPGYQQPPPAGYQQPPPAGFQPPMQTGYQPPPPVAGYPPAQQQPMAGYQANPNVMTEKPTMASAPPMETVPPPYPGK